MTRVLGLEGTAWAASAAVFDEPTGEVLVLESDAYEPDSGGIHPREAAEHMREAIPSVLEAALGSVDDIDVVAFSRGPGLGPCLRIVGTAARTLAGRRSLPLVGVNHMLAHLEIGRHVGDCAAPVCLNASGANAHLLAYRDGRYRVLGETMDTGVGNALDKVARGFGWDHPGGPKIEAAAADGDYHALPYVVKGMDFSFAGLASAAQAAVEDGVPVADVCRGLQETVFAMLTEVSERALSLTGRDALVLGGGVGQNDRLQAMLREMCAERGARVVIPPNRYLRDNAAMIAVLGARMADAGATVPIADSAVRPDFRPDQVAVTWEPEPPKPTDAGSTVRGAEALLEVDAATVTKCRRPKAYRHPDLDDRLRRERTAAEARLLHEARSVGVPTPVIVDVDLDEATLVIEHVGESDLAAASTPDRCRLVGRHLATLHDAGLVHGDPTTRNVRVNGRTHLIDFGLGYHSRNVEDFAMDLHIVRQSLGGTVDAHESMHEAVLEGYREAGDPTVLDRLAEIEGRGRYQGDDQ